MSAAAVPNRKKSYHSMVVPIRLAITTRLSGVGSHSSVRDFVAIFLSREASRMISRKREGETSTLIRHPGENRDLRTRSHGASPRDPGLRRDDELWLAAPPPKR